MDKIAADKAEVKTALESLVSEDGGGLSAEGIQNR